MHHGAGSTGVLGGIGGIGFFLIGDVIGANRTEWTRADARTADEEQAPASMSHASLRVKGQRCR